MNILLVDDEIDVLEGMLEGVNFEKLGFENVYTAQSAAQARKLLESREVEIMVTDIEMPGGSGLDLLCWVRDSQRDVVTLFCTGFAEFDYAKKAVELHSFDYFLKPISYTALEDRLQAAIHEAERIREARHYSTRREEVLRENKRAFWRSLLLEEAVDLPARQDVAENFGYAPEENFGLCLLSLVDDSEVITSWKKYAVRNVLDELLEEEGFSKEAILTLGDSDVCCIFRQSEEISKESVRRVCMKLSSFVSEHLAAWLNCYFAVETPIVFVREAFRELEDCCLDDVCSHGRVYALEEYQKQTFPYSLPQIKEWELLLASQKADQLIAQVEAHLDRLEDAGQLNMPYLKALRIDMMQMIHTVLRERQIEAHDLFSDQQFDALRERSLRSLEHMKRYLKHIISTAVEYIGFSDRSQSVINRVKEYIDSHYSEEITRVSMAKIVFLNPDYLARLFKKETGMSIGVYVQERRIYEAKKLLTQKSVQIQEVALRVGYDNFSYFSHIFREKTGLTPNEYRKQFMAEE